MVEIRSLNLVGEAEVDHEISLAVRLPLSDQATVRSVSTIARGNTEHASGSNQSFMTFHKVESGKIPFSSKEIVST